MNVVRIGSGYVDVCLDCVVLGIESDPPNLWAKVEALVKSIVGKNEAGDNYDSIKQHFLLRA